MSNLPTREQRVKDLRHKCDRLEQNIAHRKSQAANKLLTQADKAKLSRQIARKARDIKELQREITRLLADQTD